MRYNLALIGFGTLGEGLASLLLEKERLLEEHGFEYRVVAISDILKGSVYDSKG